MTRDIGYYRLPLHLFKTMPRRFDQIESEKLRGIERKLVRMGQSEFDPEALGIDIRPLIHPGSAVIAVLFVALKYWQRFTMYWWRPVATGEIVFAVVLAAFLALCVYFASRRCILVFELDTMRFWTRSLLFGKGGIVPYRDIAEIRAERVRSKSLLGYTVIMTLLDGEKIHLAMPAYTQETAAWIVDLLEHLRRSEVGETSQAGQDEPDNGNH